MSTLMISKQVKHIIRMDKFYELTSQQHIFNLPVINFIIILLKNYIDLHAISPEQTSLKTIGMAKGVDAPQLESPPSTRPTIRPGRLSWRRTEQSLAVSCGR
jgi:hypothetical protein